VVLGSLGLSGEGWFDGYLLLTALRKKAQAQGVRYVADEAVGLDTAASDGVLHVNAVRLQSGAVLPCRYAVSAGGPWAAAIAGWAGIDLPVVGKRRTVFNLASSAALPGCPLLIDTSGIWLRPEGKGFICGFAPNADNDADFAPLEPEYAAFEDHIWPLLAERIPGFEALRMQGAWAGYYEMNTFDHNAIVGLHPACDNLVFANGFSGHGLQQCPAVGRGLAEWMLTGGYQSLDLSPLSIERIARNAPLLEKNVI
jgi:FAD-dependent oxidoreductase domain-containing protein 1